MFTIKNCNFLHLSGTPIFTQLQLEEALLRNCTENICLINMNVAEAVVLGISRSPSEDLYLSVLQADNIPIIRRYSGGGTVFIDKDSILVTWIMNSSKPMISSQDLMLWTYQIYAPIFPETFAINENDYTLGDKKIAGMLNIFNDSAGCTTLRSFGIWILISCPATYPRPKSNHPIENNESTRIS